MARVTEVRSKNSRISESSGLLTRFWCDLLLDSLPLYVPLYTSILVVFIVSFRLSFS